MKPVYLCLAAVLFNVASACMSTDLYDPNTPGGDGGTDDSEPSSPDSALGFSGTETYSTLYNWRAAVVAAGETVILEDFGPPAPTEAQLLEKGISFDNGFVGSGNGEGYQWNGEGQGAVTISFLDPMSGAPSSVHAVSLTPTNEGTLGVSAKDRDGEAITEGTVYYMEFWGVTSEIPIAELVVDMLSGGNACVDDLRLTTPVR